MLCRGSEEGLSQCLHSGWGVHNCYHYEDASVICDSKLYNITVCSVVDRGVKIHNLGVSIYYHNTAIYCMIQLSVN